MGDVGASDMRLIQPRNCVSIHWICELSLVFSAITGRAKTPDDVDVTLAQVQILRSR